MSIGSEIAKEIDIEYRMNKYYKKRRISKCKDRNCDNCKYTEYCLNNESK